MRIAGVSLLLALSLSPSVRAATPEDIARGAEDFRRGCAACHGLSAKGDGVIADLMKVPPKDLTRIALRRRGVFPADEIRKVIDGRTDIKAHGGRDMPIWGLAYQDPGSSDNQEAEVRARIERIVAFLESIQEASRAAEHGEKEPPGGRSLGR